MRLYGVFKVELLYKFCVSEFLVLWLLLFLICICVEVFDFFRVGFFFFGFYFKYGVKFCLEIIIEGIEDKCSEF